MATVLITGFEPFAGHRVNASWEAVGACVDAYTGPLELVPHLLPVTLLGAQEAIANALVRYRPDWCLMLGQADGVAALMVERVALNLCDYRIPDNSGQQPRDVPVVDGGPNAYFSGLPVRAMRDAAVQAGVPAELSLSAGAYVCNSTLYQALHTVAETGLPTRCGFVHVPALPGQLAGEHRHRPTMSSGTAAQGLVAMLGCFVGR